MLKNMRLCNKYTNIYVVNTTLSNSVWNKHRPILAYTHLEQNTPHRRHLSLQSSLESLVKTQAGFFKTLSDSTPVEYMQKFLVTFHDISGLPWWATIICTTALLRTTITLPLAVYQYYIIAKLENLRLEMPAIVEELKKETAVAIKLYDWDEKMARTTFNRSIRKQWNNLIVRDNCHPAKASLLIWFQIPMWISLSMALRNLVYMLPNSDVSAKITFMELSAGGFGFIPNLTAVDASLILPVSLGIINLAIIELQSLSKLNEPSKLQKGISHFFRGFSILMVPIAASVPSCLALYWTTSSFYGLIQNVVLLSPQLRRFCGIPKTSSEVEYPYTHVYQKFKKKISIINKFK